MEEEELQTTEEVQEVSMENAIDSRIDRAKQAHSTVNRYALGSMAVAIVPLPLIDLAAVSGVQLKMVHSISKHYEIPFSRDLAKPLIASLLGDIVAVTMTKYVATNLVRLVPVAGQVSSFASSAALFGSATYAIGKIFVEHFESGGTFLNFEADKMKNNLQQLFEEGQKFVSKNK
ncbi:YcjF family protein [Candidatus Halobeggiatoa sp. HSG11]|nr:YcjF family protein [Candidatus Halobeggiatoa sp. HSG11]